MEVHDKIALNIISKLDCKNIKIENNDKVKSYALYLSKKTNIKYSRARIILTINSRRSIRITELIEIANLLETSLTELIS